MEVLPIGRAADSQINNFAKGTGIAVPSRLGGMTMHAHALAAVLLSGPICYALAQEAPTNEQRAHQPLYQVTIVAKTTKALNYGYLSAPTRIGFKGTPVAPEAIGKGEIEPKRGATLLDLRFDNLPRPNAFGPQYLTYVVWAVSPEGRVQNLGELILDGNEEGRLRSSTPLQAFALIVTAEPYYSVAQPSNVVVLENVVTSETIGKVQEVNARYELLPREPYVYTTEGKPAGSTGELVSPEQYEAMAALYQALNAIQIAQSQKADHFAPDQMARARDLYNKARSFPIHLSKEIVSMAREATQIAEDGRAISAKHAAAQKGTEGQRSTRGGPQGERAREREVLREPR
jgi:hypothetical protein